MINSGKMRNSGATLYDCVVKVGTGMDAQARVMAEHPDVYAPVTFDTEDAYHMPRLQELSASNHVAAALDKLLLLWKPGTTGDERWAKEQRRARDTYFEYVMMLQCHPRVRHCAQAWYRKTYSLVGAPAAALHGDATLENAMLHNEEAVWIDPSYKTRVPQEIEVDIGKLLQSLYGYHAQVAGSNWMLRRFFERVPHERTLAMFYFTTHLVRLWRYQEQKHEWVLNTVSEVIDAVPRV